MSMFAFHHVGVGTLDLEGAIAAYRALGYDVHARADDPVLGVRVAFLRGPGPWIEIVTPLDGSGGPLRSLIRRKQLPSPYHTCYAVDDIAVASARLREQGFFPLGEPRPAAVFQGAAIWYHIHDSIGLVELVQQPPF